MILKNKFEPARLQSLVNGRAAARPILRTGETPVTASNHVHLQRTCNCGGSCEDCRENRLQRDANSTGSAGWAPPMVHEVLRSPGEPLDAATRADLEPRFRQDFSSIRVHTDAKAAASTRAVRASAYTVGRDIVFAAGHYAPKTTADRRLLAHELTHALQQDFGVRSHALQRNDDFHLPEGELKLPPTRRPSLFKPGKEPHLHLDTCFDTILYEGTCKDLALGSKYICCDPAHGFRRRGRKKSIAEPGKACASEKWTPIFTCDNNCATALQIGCNDNDHWMAAPPSTFKRSECGKTYTTCAGGNRTTGFIRDQSVTKTRFEVSPGIQKALGVTVGDSFRGKVYAPNTPESLISADPCCTPLRPDLTLQPLTLQPKLSINQPHDAFEQEAEQVADRVAAGGPAFPGQAPVFRADIARTTAYSGQSDCSPTWFAKTEPEVDSAGESFTGKLVVTYNEAAIQSPCVRECVEVHENVHVKDLTPIVQKIRDCDVTAGSDWNKKGKCNEMASRELGKAQAGSECEAYRRSFTCLTLKVLDSASPCSKSPHREVVQKHRGFEACEMKKNCGAAGTPELGVPNA
jgi:hypothetical protein